MSKNRITTLSNGTIQICFTTIKNHNTLKQYFGISEKIVCFTTIKNHNTLKRSHRYSCSRACFTTIKNHNTLKQDGE